MCLGLPQGNVGSPLNFNIYTRNAFKFINSNYHILQFADDTVIYCSDTNLNKAMFCIQDSLNQLSIYFKNRNLFIFPSKTNLLIFSKSHVDKSTYKLKIDDEFIYPSNKCRYLGLIINDKLNWNSHVDYMINKCSKIMNILKYLRVTWWGGHPYVPLCIYKSMIRGVTDYGAFIYNFFDNKTKDKFNKMFYKALRLSLGYRISTPIKVMLAEACEPPFSIRAYYLASRYLLKVFSDYNHILLEKFNLLLSFILNKNLQNLYKKLILVQAYHDNFSKKCLVYKSDVISPFNFDFDSFIYEPDIDFDSGSILTTSKNPNYEFKKLFLDPYLDDHFNFYTDGSKNGPGNYVGFCFYSSD